MNKATEKLLALIFLAVTTFLEMTAIIVIMTSLVIPGFYLIESAVKKSKEEQAQTVEPETLEDRQDRMLRDHYSEETSA